MKKIKICLLLLMSMAFVFTGCAGINGYLKVAQTQLSLATFYNNNYVQGISVFENVTNDSTVLYTETDRIAYKNYTNPLYQLLPEERCMISAMDFLYEINNTQNVSIQKITLKPYEYRTVIKQELEIDESTSVFADNYANIKAVILVERNSKSNNMELNTYLFYMDVSASYEVADLQANISNAHYTYTFVQTNHNIQTQTFYVKYNTNCNASASFNQEKGCLNYSMETVFGSNNTQVKLEKSIYYYSNATAGIRVLIENGVGGQNIPTVYEQMTSDFYKRLKVGAVKDKANMISLETMPENKLAMYNSSDSVGYLFTFDARNDNEVARIICENYGQNA